MSVLGDLVRLDPELLEELRSVPGEAYDRLLEMDPEYRVDLDRDWAVLSFLMRTAGFPLDPMTAGQAFPDEDTAWGAGDDYPLSRSLTPPEVAQIADRLNRTSFDVLAPHLPAALAANDRSGVPLTAERLDGIGRLVGQRYAALVTFFDIAAKNAQCTVFWAA
ncbi:DUF1877 family protein [Plantactinospora sp. B5E13]|uniref:DUF1877 family protein n=1 Tax=unclassified Plantactinospora TaxID=2631981 RepID=UPI00325C3EDC